METTDQTKTVQALEVAIRMEIDGKEYYEKLAGQTDNKLGQELLKWLAHEEDKHRRRFEEIFRLTTAGRDWPSITPTAKVKETPAATLFARAMKAPTAAKTASQTEMDGLTVALKMEDKTRKFYEGRAKEAVHSAEKDFYSAIAAEERGHYLYLTDYQEYLIDPADWFTKREHHSLDGG